MNLKRVTVFTGHYGSGKTSIALAYARMLRAFGKEVTIGDMDIVNPYFRTADGKEELEAQGIELVCSPFANSNLDLPALPKELYRAVTDKSRYAVLDVGGDDRGAVALGRFAPDILAEGDYEVAFVVNLYRPLTKDAGSAAQVLREVERAGGLRCTGLINNSNLGAATRGADVLATGERMEELMRLTGLPLLFTACKAALAAELSEAPGELFPLKPLQAPGLGASGPG